MWKTLAQVTGRTDIAFTAVKHPIPASARTLSELVPVTAQHRITMSDDVVLVTALEPMTFWLVAHETEPPHLLIAWFAGPEPALAPDHSWRQPLTFTFTQE
jgi:hypothetical protein